MKSILFLIIMSFSFFSSQESGTLYTESPIVTDQDDLKIQAFEILKSKCNICHQEKNKRRVFTLGNMNKNRKKIYRQVFKWKRMPKGDEIKLTIEEYSQLENWLLSLKK